MSKTLELKSAFTTKKEWLDYAKILYDGGKFNLDQYSKLCHAIEGSKLPED